jgi:hypothetical protein
MNSILYIPYNETRLCSTDWKEGLEQVVWYQIKVAYQPSSLTEGLRKSTGTITCNPVKTRRKEFINNKQCLHQHSNRWKRHPERLVRSAHIPRNEKSTHRNQICKTCRNIDNSLNRLCPALTSKASVTSE